MNKIMLCCLALLLTSVGWAQTSNSTNSPKQTAAERYIRDSEAKWAESVATGDSSVVERILADDFIGVDPNGKVYGKVEMIADTKTAPKYFRSNKLDYVNIRFFGNTAVAQGSESWERQNGTLGQFVWMDTWVKRKGKWQIVAAEDLIPPPPKVKP